MELSRKQTALIIGGTVAGVAGIGALFWFMSRPAAAGPTTMSDCSIVDYSEANIWRRPKWVLQETYRGVRIYRDDLKRYPHPKTGQMILNPSYGAFGAFISSGNPSSALKIEDVRQMIDDACPGGMGAHGEEIRWYEQHPQMPKPCEPWPGCLDTKSAPVITPSSVPREMPTGHERPHPEWCDCYSCGC